MPGVSGGPRRRFGFAGPDADGVVDRLEPARDQLDR